MSSIATLTQYTRILRDTGLVKQQETDLQRQLSSGYKTDVFSGLGIDAARSVNLRETASRITSYQRNIDLVQARTEVLDTAMQRVGSLVTSVISDLNKLDGTTISDPTVVRNNARQALEQIYSLLNTQVEGRYVFAASDETTPPVNNLTGLIDTYDRFYTAYLNAPAGAATRLDFDGDGTTIGDADDALAPGPTPADPRFVFNGVGPEGGAFVFDVTGTPPPAPGDTYSVTLNGTTFTTTVVGGGIDTTEEIVADLRAQIQADPAFSAYVVLDEDLDAAANSRAMLRIQVPKDFATATASGAGPGASLTRVPSDIEQLNLAMQRVVRDPALAYEPGMNGVGTLYSSTLRYANAPMVARVDDNLDVTYGVRADASYFRNIIQGLAMVANLERPDDPEIRSRYYDALHSARDMLQAGSKDLNTAVASVGAVRRNLDQLEVKHKAVLGIVNTNVGEIEDADIATVVTRLNLAETQLQAGYRTIASLNKTSILDYLT